MSIKQGIVEYIYVGISIMDQEITKVEQYSIMLIVTLILEKRPLIPVQEPFGLNNDFGEDLTSYII